MTGKIRVEKRDLDLGLLELEEEWNALLRRSTRPTIYSTFDYVYTSCVHFKRTEDIFFLFFRDDSTGTLLAIFPLSVWDDHVYGVHVQTLEHGITTKNTDVDKPYPIIDRDHEQVCWSRYRDYFRKEYREWDLIVYDELISESYLNSGLRKLFPFPQYYTKIKPGPHSPMVRLDGEWDVFWQKHSNMRKKNRRMETKIGDRFAYKVFSDPADVERCLNEYIATEQAGWKAGEGVSQEDNQKFYHELLPKLAARGQLYFGMMYDGDKVISAEISYVFMDRVYFALGTYNPEYKALSPGTVSTSRFIRFFHDKGYVDGDFLAGFAEYVNPWACRIDKTINIAIRRMGYKNGYLAFRHLMKKAARRLKRILEGLPTAGQPERSPEGNAQPASDA
jgi:hypothetical protein